MKEINKTIKIVPLPLNSPKSENMYTSLNNPIINQLQKSNLSLVFSSPLIHKQKNKRISQEETLTSKIGDNPPFGSYGEKETYDCNNSEASGEKEKFNIFKEKETLKKIFSNQIEKQRKFNNNLDNYLGYNTKIHYFENLIFVKDNVQISNSLTTLNNEKFKKEKEFQIEKKDYYQLTLNINNYLFILSKFVMTLNSKSSIWNSTLFMPKRFLVRQPNVKYEIMLRSVKKTLVQKVIPKINIETVTQNPTALELTNTSALGPTLPTLAPPLAFRAMAGGGGGEKAVELKNKRKKKLLILEKKLITNLLKQGINLILYLNILINQKKMDIKTLINLQNINSIEPALLEKISNIFSPPLGRVGPRVETKIFKSKLELELNVFELFYDLEDSPISPYLGVENLSRVTQTETQNQSHKQPLEDTYVLRKKQSYGAYGACGASFGEALGASGESCGETYGNANANGEVPSGEENLRDKKQKQEQVPKQEQELVSYVKSSRKISIKKESKPTETKEPLSDSTGLIKEKEKIVDQCLAWRAVQADRSRRDLCHLRLRLRRSWPIGKILNKSKNEIFISALPLDGSSLGNKDNLEFETPELTKLPFSLLHYKNKNKNKNNYPYPYNNNLQLKTIPFSLLLNKNTVLEGKNAVKLSIVTSHFDLDKNNTRERDTVQTSALSSTASLSLVNGAENYDSVGVENSVHKPVISQYLKELSIYNIRNKGIIIFYYILIGFHFNTDLNKSFTSGKKTKNINKLLAASFKSMYCLISKPVFITTPDKIIVQLFYYLFIPNVLKLKKFFKYKDKDNDNKVINTYFNREPIVKNYDNSTPPSPSEETLKSSKSQILAISKLRKKEISLRKKIFKKQYNKFRKIKINVRVKLRKLSNISLVKVFPNKFKFLSLILNNIFKKPVVFDLVRIHYPYNDSNILVNLLGIMINKIKLRIIIRRFFEKAIIKNINKLKEKRGIIIPSFLSGLTIRVAGRLLTHKVVPRLTVKTTSRGATASGRINFKDIATYTNKNKRGAYSITVKAGQNLF